MSKYFVENNITQYFIFGTNEYLEEILKNKYNLNKYESASLPTLFIIFFYHPSIKHFLKNHKSDAYFANDENFEKIVKLLNFDELPIVNLNICHNAINLKEYIEKKIKFDNVIQIKNDFVNNNIIVVLLQSCIDKKSNMVMYVDNTELSESNILYGKSHITPNYIDNTIYKKWKIITIIAPHAIQISIKNVIKNEIKLEGDFYVGNPHKTNIYKNDLIFKNRIAIICDKFTYNSFKDLINLEYISKYQIDNVDINKYDFLLCESIWDSMDESWINQKLEGIEKITSLFKKNNKKTVFYNKEDPTNFNNFINFAQYFDVIITTSELCVPKYKELWPEKIIYSYSFCCNPIVHNPIRNSNWKKDRGGCFIGGFYENFIERTKHMNCLFDYFLKTNEKLTIINRHTFTNKKTHQIKKFLKKKCCYKIPAKFEKYEYPVIPSDYAISMAYKKYIININLNTVTDCPTMSSRRLIELAGCGSNILSNNSAFIENNSFDIITPQLNPQKKLKEINLINYYEAHTKYSYVFFFEKIYKTLNFEIINNVKFKINIKNSNLLCKDFHKYLDLNEYTHIVNLYNQNFYYDNKYLTHMLLPLYYFDGSVFETNDEEKYFTICDKYINNEKQFEIISNISTKILLIPNIPI